MASSATIRGGRERRHRETDQAGRTQQWTAWERIIQEQGNILQTMGGGEKKQVKTVLLNGRLTDEDWATHLLEGEMQYFILEETELYEWTSGNNHHSVKPCPSFFPS